MKAAANHHFVGRWGTVGGAFADWTAGAGEIQDQFDLASLTKPIVTSSLLMMTCERSQYDWQTFVQTPLSDWIVELETSSLSSLTLRDVWEHRGRLPAHIDFLTGETAGHESNRAPLAASWSRASAWQSVLTGILNAPLGNDHGTVYSDLGYLLLGLGLERFHGRSLDELWDEWKHLHGWSKARLPFFGRRTPSQKLVVSETRYPRGEVNDNNAYLLGGVAPQAGIYGTAQDVWDWLALVQSWAQESQKIAPWLAVPAGWNSRFYCGWDRPGDPQITLAGAGAPADTIGHLGYTGTAFWWSPKTGTAGVLLSNRVWPKPSPENAEMIKNLRREFFTALWQGTLTKEWQPIQAKLNGPT